MLGEPKKELVNKESLKPNTEESPLKKHKKASDDKKKSPPEHQGASEDKNPQKPSDQQQSKLKRNLNWSWKPQGKPSEKKRNYQPWKQTN